MPADAATHSPAAAPLPLPAPHTGHATKRTREQKWSPRVWEGMDCFAWLRMLAANNVAVGPRYAYIAAIISANSVTNTAFRWMVNARFGNLVRSTPVHSPVFVIGHWRTGTTLLHELLIRDEQFGFPDMQDCFNPCHALLTGDFFKRYLRFLLPSKRPMDNMHMGWERPQEDEFALALLGLPSTYTDFAFPHRPPMHPGALDLTGLTSAQLARWKRVFVRFLQEVTLRTRKRLVLKSPPHTARLPVLLELFPEAKFLHIVRDPRAVYPSTVKLWQSMARAHGLQKPEWPGLDQKVLREFCVIYDRLEQAKPLLKAGQFHEVRYEELVRNPITELKKAYETLNLGDFDAARPRMEEYLRQNAKYETNKHELTPEQMNLVMDHWGDVIRRFGYAE